MSKIEPAYIRRADAMKYLGISARTLTDWQNRRIVPFAKVSHRVVLFKKTDLDKAIARMTTPMKERSLSE